MAIHVNYLMRTNVFGQYLIHIQETPQCDETRFSTLQPSINMTGIRNERWQ